MSDDLARQMERHRDELAVRWDDTRDRKLGHAVQIGPVVRRERRRAVIAVSVVTVVAALAVVAMRPAPGLVTPTVSAPQIEGAVVLADGSSAVPFGRGALVRLVEESRSSARIALESGAARFDVAHQDGRSYQVEAGPVTVTVLGTSFVVSRSGDEVDVEVMRGRVRVEWATGRAELAAGEAGHFGAPALEPAPVPPSTSVETTSPASGDGATVVPPPRPRAPDESERADPPPALGASWRTLARDGDFDGAWEALDREGVASIRDEPGELLLAADVARHTHHSDRAVAPLEAILDRHATDPRAGLAAFTLGRVLLEELGRPRDAAEAFRRAGELHRSGQLSEDALAREVESWSRAGEATRAEARAREYLERYPQGHRAASVRRFGGVE